MAGVAPLWLAGGGADEAPAAGTGAWLLDADPVDGAAVVAAAIRA